MEPGGGAAEAQVTVAKAEGGEGGDWVRARAVGAATEVMWDMRVNEELRGRVDAIREVASRCHDILMEGRREEGAGECSQRKRQECCAVLWAAAMGKETENGEHEGAVNIGGTGGV